MEKIRKITPEEVYVTVFSQHPVVNEEGWSRIEPTDRTPPLCGDRLVDQVAHIVRTHKLYEASAIATRLGLTSTDDLNAAMRLLTGRNTHDFAIEYLLLEARELMVHTNLSSIRIARHIGMETRENFVRTFQRRVGQPVTTWRRIHHKKEDVGRYIL